MEGLTMIGIKNNNGFFRISVAVIMLLSILGLRMRATPHDTVDSYSETFYAFYGFLKDKTQGFHQYPLNTFHFYLRILLGWLRTRGRD